jgi:ABC-2 type transport system permease protein
MSAVAVVRTELYKSTRRLRTYVAYGIVCLIPVIMTVALKANPPGPPGEGGGFLLYLGSQSGLLIPAVALRFTSEFLLVIVVALFAGEAIAGEATWGNLRYLLMRPIPRGRLFASKLIVATLCGWFAVVLVVVVGLVAGGIAFGWHTPQLGFGTGFAFFQQSTSDVLWHLALSVVYVCWILTSVIAFSYMIGVLTDSTFGAIFAGVGLWMTWLILDQIEPLGSIRDAFPTHYSGDWSYMFKRDLVSNSLWHGALVALGYVVVFIGFGAWWFRRKDILS